MSRATRGLLRAAAVSLVAVAMGPVGVALAEPPNVTIESPANGSLGNNRTPSISGSTDDPLDDVTVRIYAGPAVAGAPKQTLTAALPLTGAWSTPSAETLADGTYTAQATQTNLADEEGTSEAVTFTVDTSSPTVTLNPPPSPSNDTTPSFSGFASDTTPVTVQIYSGPTTSGTPVASATATHTGGDWSSTQASPALTSGQYTAVATQESSLGNPAGTSSSVTFTVDTSAPTVTLDQPKSPSNNTTPSFTGSASDTTPVAIRIYAGATADGTAVATAAATGTGGAWSSGKASPALASGQYTAVATQESSLGNPTGESAPVTFTVDTSSPTVTLNQPTALSNDTTPSFTGTASGTTTVTVQIYAGAAAEGTVVATATASGTGAGWTSGNASPALASGQYTARAVQQSPLGNPPGVSQPVTFRVDTAPPTVTLSSPALRSNNTTPSFTGTASDTTIVTVRIYAGTTAKDTVVSSATATGSGGAWSSGKASPALVSGQYTAVATQASSLGNPAGESAPATFTVDTSSPTVTLSQPKTPSNNTTPSFIGTASDTTTVTVHVYAGITAKGTVVSSATATGSGGAWGSGKASPALVSGQYTAVATQESSLGNPKGESAPMTFTVDTTSPSVTLSQPKTPSNNRTPSFSGNASDTTAVLVRVYDSTNAEVASVTATPNGEHHWSSGGVSPALSTGKHTYTAVATQQSSLGNPPGESTRVTFTVDTTSPSVTLSQPKTPSNDRTPSFSGNASDTTAVLVRVYDSTNAEVASVTATPNGEHHWSSGAVSPALSTGKHSYTAVATQQSSLGNPAGESSRVTFTVDTTAPVVTIEQPISHSNNTRPSFSGTATDITIVTVTVHQGTKATGTVVATATGTPSAGNWVSGNVDLPEGKNTYTAVASQASSLGNPTGTSSPVTFTVDTAAPSVTLDAPATRTNSTTPSFTGTTDEATPVLVHIYGESDSEVATATAPATVGSWVSGDASPALPDGQYTAIATQDSLFGNHTGETAPFAFTVDTGPPQVTLTFPSGGSSTSGGSQLVGGSAGTAPGDLPSVTARLFSGSEILDGQAPLQSIHVPAGDGQWSATFAGLSAGTYSVRAEQLDEGGNLGVSAPTSFSVLGASAAAAPSGPTASFAWAPTAPRAGEPVSLLSNSTDLASPITGFAWDPTGTGAFAAGGPVTRTSFATAGKHLVRLRVTDASGLSDVAAETIDVAPATLPLMQPFPTVRITATRRGRGIKLKLLSVRTSAGARVTVKCAGRGCPVRSQSRVAAAGKVGTEPIEFRRFERSLRAGVVLEIRISKPGAIGKYTRFSIRRGKLPARTDACLSSTAGSPIPCPAS